MNYDYCVYDNKNEYLVTTQSCSGREKNRFGKSSFDGENINGSSLIIVAT